MGNDSGDRKTENQSSVVFYIIGNETMALVKMVFEFEIHGNQIWMITFSGFL